MYVSYSNNYDKINFFKMNMFKYACMTGSLNGYNIIISNIIYYCDYIDFKLKL